MNTKIKSGLIYGLMQNMRLTEKFIIEMSVLISSKYIKFYETGCL